MQYVIDIENNLILMDKNGNGYSSAKTFALPPNLRNDFAASISEWKMTKKMPGNHPALVKLIESYIMENYGEIEPHVF